LSQTCFVRGRKENLNFLNWDKPFLALGWRLRGCGSIKGKSRFAQVGPAQGAAMLVLHAQR
jgi:hypothetical protein